MVYEVKLFDNSLVSSLSSSVAFRLKLRHNPKHVRKNLATLVRPIEAQFLKHSLCFVNKDKSDGYLCI